MGNVKGRAIRFLASVFLRNGTGMRFISALSDYSSGYSYGSYTIQDEAALALSFYKGGTIIDAGANVGNWSRALLKLKSNLSELVMIEPNLDHRIDHEAISREFPCKITTEWVALGSQHGKMWLYYDAEKSTLASLYERKIKHHQITLANKKEVIVDTLQKICARHNIKEIDFLKLDLEGHELAALHGAEGMINNYAIKALQFEMGGCNIDSRTFFKDFWEFLCLRHGYDMYRILPKRRLLKICSYTEALERFTWQNVLACAPGTLPQWTIVEQ